MSMGQRYTALTVQLSQPDPKHNNNKAEHPNKIRAGSDVLLIIRDNEAIELSEMNCVGNGGG